MHLKRVLLLATLFAVPSLTMAIPTNPLVVPLAPTSGMLFSVSLAISSDYKEAVGVSSNQQIVLDAHRIITLQPNQVLVPTIWTIPSPLPWVSYGSPVPPITGTAFAGVTGNAALYGVSPSVGGAFSYVGTTFGALGATTGFITVGGVAQNFVASVNSYGLGIGGPGGNSMGVGWYYNGTTTVPCAYLTNAPTGAPEPVLVTLSTQKGMAEACSSVGLGITKWVEASIVGFVDTPNDFGACWDIYYIIRPTVSGPYVENFSGLEAGALYTLDPVFDTWGAGDAGSDYNYAMGTFLYSVMLGSLAGTSTNTKFLPVAYSMGSATIPAGTTYPGSYVGQLSSGDAFESELENAYGTNLLTSLNGIHWGPVISSPTQSAIGSSYWTKLNCAYGLTLNGSGYEYYVGYGNYGGSTLLPPIAQCGFLVFSSGTGLSGGGGGGGGGALLK